MKRTSKLFLAISIAFYFLIMLQGQIIMMPFFTWIFASIFDFGEIDQLFAIIAISALFWVVYGRHKKRKIGVLALDIFCLGALASPLIWRLSVVPLKLFFYWEFIVPAVGFVVFYICSIIITLRK